MKNILLLIMLLFVASSIGFALSKVEINQALTEKPQVKSITVDLGDITNLTEGELSQLITESVNARIITFAGFAVLCNCYSESKCRGI